MKRLDAGKAVGLAVLILALNLLLAFLAVVVYAVAIEPGRPQAFYSAEAPRIAGWSAPLGGALLFLIAAWVLGRRRPGRDPLRFALLTWVAYVILDLGSGAAAGDVHAMLSLQMTVSMGLALLGALAGAALAKARSAPPVTPTPPSPESRT
jgi:hypothetical protein